MIFGAPRRTVAERAGAVLGIDFDDAFHQLICAIGSRGIWRL
jgi:hypothetical protein